MGGPIPVAHRGGADEAPENTLAAFRRALDLGIRWFELDVQMTHDGALVVIHDETVDRTTSGSGEVRALTYEEISALDAGSWFGPEYAQQRVPTLREMLEFCMEEGAGVFVELKSPHLYPGIEQKVASLLGELFTRGASNLWCISFDPDSLARLHAIDPVLPLGQLYSLDTEDLTRTGPAIEAVLPHFATVAAFPEQVARAHEQGKRVVVWTVNEREDMARMAELGVDAIMSDRLSLLRQLVNS